VLHIVARQPSKSGSKVAQKSGSQKRRGRKRK